MTLQRNGRLTFDPQKAAERRARREARRAAEPTRPEDVARQARRTAREGPQSPAERRASRAWYLATIAGGCVVCQRFPPDAQTYRERRVDIDWMQAHHLLEQQWLKRWAPAYLWDVRIGLGVCRWHHGRHTDAVQRIPRLLIPPAAFACADEIDRETGAHPARCLLEDTDVYPLVA